MTCITSRLLVNDFLVRPAGFEGFFANAKSQVLTSPQQCLASYCVFHAMYFWYARQGSKASLLTQSRRFSPRLNNAQHHITSPANDFLVRPAGFEPATPWFEAKYSNPLSYGRLIGL